MGSSLLSRSATLRVRPRDPQYDRAGSAAEAQTFSVADAAQKVLDHTKAADPHKDREWASAQFVPLSYFDGTGQLATSRLPALAISDVFPASSEAQQRGLTAQRGDMCVRTDISRTFILRSDDPTSMANWIELSSAGQVISVNGQSGVIVLTAADVGAAALVHGNRHRPGGEDDISTQYIGWHMRGVANGVEAFGAAASAQSAAANDATSKVEAHRTANDPHGSRTYTDSAITTHRQATDPHGDRVDAANKVEAHRTANDPHGDRADATSKVEAHRLAADPHGDRAWVTTTYLARMIPAGGAAGQVLAKTSATNYDLSWITPASGGSSSAALVPYPPVDQPFSNSVTPNAQTGNYRTMTATADFTLNPPTNPADGQRVHIRWVASGAQRTMTFNSALKLPIVNGIVMSNTLIAPTGKRADVVMLYDLADSAWSVLSAQVQS